MKDKSLLWELVTPGKPTSYLYGTMHLSNYIAFKHLGRALPYLQSCDSFYAEINLDEAQERMDPSAYLLPDGHTLSYYFSKKKYEKIKRVLLGSFAFDLAKYEQFLPMMVTNKLSEQLLESAQGKTLDAELWHQAKLANLGLHGLESLDEQLTLLKDISLEEQLKTLKTIVKDVNKFRKINKKLGEYYLNQDIYQLHKLSRSMLGRLRKPLIYNRNEIMVKRILGLLETKSFFAVGAGHLGGKKGMLTLLKHKGIKIKALNKTKDEIGN